MNLYYAFSRNEKIGSKLISTFSGLLVKDLEKVPSHIAILLEFEGIEERFIAEAVLEGGVRLIPFSVWLTHNELCYLIPCDKTKDPNEVFGVLKRIWGKKYDWLGLLFFGVCFIRHFLFKTPFPAENAWQSDDKFFCSEAAGELSGYGKHSMATPAKMCSDFLKLTT